MKIIFLGSQGSGKSTQAKLLAQKLNLPHIEMGQIFRERATKSDSNAQMIRKALDEGNLVPDEIATITLKEKISEPQCKNGYILDGYPRNDVQLAALNENIDKVFYIKVSDEEAIRRLLLRLRHDDTKEALTKRLGIYHQKTEPLLSVFRKKNILEEINGERTIKEIHRDVLKRIKK